MFWKIMIILSFVIAIFVYLIILGANKLKTPKERAIEDAEQEEILKEIFLEKENKLKQKQIEKERKRRLKYEKINNRRKTKCSKRNCKDCKSNTKE